MSLGETLMRPTTMLFRNLAAMECFAILLRNPVRNGVGIMDGAPDRIFDPFISTKPHGMGLGLSICKSIVEAHMGRIWATFGDEGGATFHVALPVSRTPGSGVPPPQ